MSKQVNLHCHSEGSFLDGYSKVTDIAARTVELGQEHIALTDHGECNQHLAFQKACLDKGIHPVFGMEGYHIADIQAARDTKKYPIDSSHICLLAKDQRGLENLWTWSSIAYDKEHHYYRPLADPALMREYAAGLYASDGCMMTGLGKAVELEDHDAARQYVSSLLDIFRERFYMELHTWQFIDPQSDRQRDLNQLMTNLNQVKLQLATEMGVPLVVVNDSHHAWPEDWEKKDFLCKIKKDKGDQVADGQKADHMMGEEELFRWMSLHGIGRSVVEEAINNSWEIAQSCTAEIKPTLGLPSFTGNDRDDISKFIDLVEQGYHRKVADHGSEVYWQRMEHEVETIVNKGLAGYFLVVADYVKAAKDGSWAQWVNPGGDKDPMRLGPGRGSGGGSLVCWLLDITAMNPIKYDLLFERFLAPGRKGYPDIDTDFPQSKRQGMKSYLEARYRADHVCTIGTITRNAPKAMLRDLGRALDLPKNDINALSKIIVEGARIAAAAEDEEGEQVGWDEILESKGGELAAWVHKGPQYAELFEKMGQMVGVARQSGVHPSGVLVNRAPLMGKIPMRTRGHSSKKDMVTTTQFDMDEVEWMGGVKFDLLGVRHLDTIDNAAKLIEERHGRYLDYEQFGDKEYSDPAIWERIDKGQTAGIFQVETPLATKTIVDLKPRNESDIAALVAIIRPGVKDAGEDQRFLMRRAGLEPVRYDHPMMEPITSETYGVLVYQEQMLRAAKELAGFTPDEADSLRKGLGKKLADVVEGYRQKFLDGCLANIDFMEPFHDPVNQYYHDDEAEAVVAKIWASISASARYAFNKSHAVGYGLISANEIWTHHYYPLELLVELMATDPDSLNRYVREARRAGIQIYPPDVNLSAKRFSITGDGVRYGIESLRGIAAATSRDILNGRPYLSLEDYIARAEEGSNKAAVINLIKVGAFDSIDPDRAGLLYAYQRHRILESVAPRKRSLLTQEQQDQIVAEKLTNYPDKWVIDVPDFSDPLQVHKIEMDLVGNYITVDPMEPYSNALEAVAVSDPDQITDYEVGQDFVIGGQVTSIKTHVVTKGRTAGKEMAFLGILHNEQEFDIVIFPDMWNQTKSLLEIDAPVACKVVRTDRGCHMVGLERLDRLWKTHD